MNAIILSVGDELVLGQTVDTNSAWISQQLAAVGCDIRGHATVADDQKEIERAIRDAAGRCDFLVISGGIGPTEDDLTRQALAAVLGVPLEINETWLVELRKFFEARGRVMPESNKIQAMIPRGAAMLFNHAGTAAGMTATIESSPKSLPPLPPLEQLLGRPIGRVLTKMGRTSREQIIEALDRQMRDSRKLLLGEVILTLGYIDEADLQIALAAQKGESIGVPKPPAHACRVFVVPGVPKEMKAMVTRDVLPVIAAAGGGAVILSRTLHTFGLGESWVAERLGPLMMRAKNPSVGTTVSQGIVSLRINARFESPDRARVELHRTTEACRAALGSLIFGQDADTLQEVVVSLLIEAKRTVATAESCTGGLLAKMLTDVSGSSACFGRGWVTYANEAKTEELGVPPDLLASHGAVSEVTVLAMAREARRRARADFALAISGVAGPTGGTPQKPVGTVWIALADADGAAARHFNFPGDREMIRDRAAKMALTLLRFRLLGEKLPF